jgi:hypothetical protein
MQFWDFLQAFWSNWFAIMSGGPSVPAAILAHFVQDKTAKAFLWLTVAASIFLSAYFVWQDEHGKRVTAEQRVVQLETRYPYSLSLDDVQSVEERTPDPKIKFGFLSRKMQFKLMWANTIDPAIAYQMRDVMIDGKDIPVPHAVYPISGRERGQFYIPYMGAPLQPTAREVHIVKLKYRYGEPDHMNRCVDRTIRYEITFLPGGGVSWVDSTAPKDVPCR